MPPGLMRAVRDQKNKKFAPLGRMDKITAFPSDLRGAFAFLYWVLPRSCNFIALPASYPYIVFFRPFGINGFMPAIIFGSANFFSRQASVKEPFKSIFLNITILWWLHYIIFSADNQVIRTNFSADFRLFSDKFCLFRVFGRKFNNFCGKKCGSLCFSGKRPPHARAEVLHRFIETHPFHTHARIVHIKHDPPIRKSVFPFHAGMVWGFLTLSPCNRLLLFPSFFGHAPPLPTFSFQRKKFSRHI